MEILNRISNPGSEKERQEKEKEREERALFQSQIETLRKRTNNESELPK